MGRPVTLFTGQWADLPLETIAQKANEWGFDEWVAHILEEGDAFLKEE